MRRPLRVVLALESSGPGGAEQMVLLLAEALRDVGDVPSILTLRPGWMTERAEALGFPVHIVPQRPGVDVSWTVRMARWLRRERIDVLHTHEFAMNIFGGAAALLSGTRCIATIHGRHWIADRPRRPRAYRLLRRLGMPLVAVSHDLAGFLEDRFGLDPGAIHVVHNGVRIPRLEDGVRDRQDARRGLEVPEAGPLLVAVGNLYPVKDHATLLRAARELPGTHVAIAGRGEEEGALRRLAAELGIADRVHLLGLRDDIDRVLVAADVFVQPSLSEGLPMAILEAMARGVPVVATAVGGVPEALVDGDNGVLVPPGDPVLLARAIGQVIESSDRREAMAAAAREAARAQFSVEAMRSSYRSLYVNTQGH